VRAVGQGGQPHCAKGGERAQGIPPLVSLALSGSARRVAGKGCGPWKNKATVAGGAWAEEERDGGGQALESSAVACSGSRVRQPLLPLTWTGSGLLPV